MLGNDTDVDGDPLTPVVVSGPSNGTLTLNANGVFTYTPNANFNGSDSFTYRVSDGQVQSNVATVSLTVRAVNDAPAASGQSLSTDEDTPVSGAVSASDVEGDPLTYAVVTGPRTVPFSSTRRPAPSSTLRRTTTTAPTRSLSAPVTARWPRTWRPCR